MIVATGSRPRKSGYTSLRPDVEVLPGAGQPNVFTVWDVFESDNGIGQRVLLVDEDPHLSGAYVAEHLADHGHEVEIVTSQLHAARDLAINHVPELYARLGPKGITITSNTIVTGIDGQDVHVIDRYSGEQRTIKAMESIVLAMGNEACEDLYHALKGSNAELYRVGDCLAPRRIDDAVLDGERAGWMV